MAAPKNAFSMSQFIWFFSLVVFSSCSSRLRDCLASPRPQPARRPFRRSRRTTRTRRTSRPTRRPGAAEVVESWLHFATVVQYMESYWNHLKGSTSGRKQVENQCSKLARIHHFLRVLANGGRWPSTWTALENMRRIYEWPEHLRREGKAVTTIKSYIVNIMEFIGFFKETPLPTSRVSKRTLVAVHRALSSTVSGLGRRVAVRQIQVKRAKLKHLVPKRHLRACRARCREKIPCVLNQLEEDSSGDLMRRFYVLLSLYISCVYGHRTGVLQNMTVLEVAETRSSRDEERDEGFLINVSRRMQSSCCHLGSSSAAASPAVEWQAGTQCPPLSLCLSLSLPNGQGPQDQPSLRLG
ncbi:PREDICTED: uncharacterized protein LOC106921144 [Poecilia mexicana]|uniref:uncharacterized protein LOC106921144 n=1 Tax=Poecilia mexicana TaxID=48701 RepID=UPI00072D9B83|nr:PREDICTED: uncharacterized protein LOC106921144 [Poecilia mexicana]XP_016528706.1 PREDICTED: uncharacterized protein LOC107836649 [Poecilia formosa]XP_016528707.1 PREDICTED: uncharacterized protein LOC107836650 [Poecilia formosa]